MSKIYTEVEANKGFWNSIKHFFTGNNYYTTESGVTVKTGSTEGSVFEDEDGKVYVDGMKDVSIYGTNHEDAIFVSNSQVNKIEGNNGDDYIEVLDCDNVGEIFGGNGNDYLVSWNSNVKKLEGNRGNDKLIVSGGSVNYMHGAQGDDTLYTQRNAKVTKADGGRGNDTFDINRSTVDEIVGYWGADDIEVKDSNVKAIYGGTGSDTIKVERSKVGNADGGFGLFGRDNIYCLDSEIEEYHWASYKKQSTTRKKAS